MMKCRIKDPRGRGDIPEEVTRGLYYYGIQSEKAYLRAHVGVLAKTLFVFERKPAVVLILSVEYPWVFSRQDGVEGYHGIGYLVPPGDLRQVWTCPLEEEWLLGFTEGMDTTIAGRRAEEIVKRCFESGRMGSPKKLEFQEGRQKQIFGADFKMERTGDLIEAKLDYRSSLIAHTPQDRCTGNLFLQVWERNPLKKH